MVITDDYPTKISLFMERQKKMPIKIRFINWHLNGGGGGIRTRVLFSPPIKDYTFRSISILNIPKYVIEFLHPPSPIDVRLDFRFGRFSTFVRLLFLGYMSRPVVV